MPWQTIYFLFDCCLLQELPHLIFNLLGNTLPLNWLTFFPIRTHWSICSCVGLCSCALMSAITFYTYITQTIRGKDCKLVFVKWQCLTQRKPTQNQPYSLFVFMILQVDFRSDTYPGMCISKLRAHYMLVVMFWLCQARLLHLELFEGTHFFKFLISLANWQITLSRYLPYQ